MPRQEFRWKARPAMAGAPDLLHPWLADAGSLTARIVARCDKFQVRVLRETRALPCPDERTLIGLPPGRYAWVREVLLIADGVPVVFAHSVLAPRDLVGAWHMAQAIGSRPLGAALFADPCIRRGALAAARLTTAHPLHRHAASAVGIVLPTLWGRRSRFNRLGRPLLVTEVFLPGITELAEISHHPS
jgi:chorismate--pyruvate lyase